MSRLKFCIAFILTVVLRALAATAAAYLLVTAPAAIPRGEGSIQFALFFLSLLVYILAAEMRGFLPPPPD